MKHDKQSAAQPQVSEGESGSESEKKSSPGGWRPRSGRKPKAEGKETGPTRSIRLPRELDFKLKAIALRQRKTPAQVLKLLAVDALEKYDEVVII